jgi:5S rRNA maturation endonuclease (ribonuclease M5)
MDAATIEAVLRGIGAERVRVVSSAKVDCCCPLAFWTHPKGRDSRPSMVVFVEGRESGRPYYTCLSCHEKGSLRDLLLFLWTRGRDTFRWVEVLDGDAPASAVKSKAEKLREEFRRSSFQGFNHITDHRKLTGKPFYDYKALVEAEKVEEMPWSVYEPYTGSVPRYALVDRELTVETCKEWELGHDKRMKRLLFPIRDRKGRLVAISGRVYVDDCPRCGGGWIRPCEHCGLPESEHLEGGLCDDGISVTDYKPTRETCAKCGIMRQPKYLHSKGFPRRFIMYGEHRQEMTKDRRVYVVEGHLDMIKMWQAGYRPVVAMLGSHPSPPQVEKLVKYWGKIIVVPDGNQAGRDMGRRIEKMVAGRVPVTVKKLEEGLDPGKMTVEEMEALLGPPPLLMAA